jgi:dihydroorotate dehydrogenase (NAD+) catalytic subunit
MGIKKNNDINLSVNLSVNLGKVSLINPLITASGTCGYVDELDDFLDINQLGAFITKSITIKPRLGNDVPRIVETDSGMLNAIGLANIGVEKFIQEKVPMMERYKTPFFVNIAGQTIDEYLAVADKLSQCRRIAGLELNISCPNVKQGGITFGTDPALVRQITTEVKKVVRDKILVVKLTPSVTDISAIARAAVECGADALSLVNTFTAMVIDIETQKPVLANRTGGLSGPAIKPIAVYLVNKVYNEVAKPAGVPIIGGGGIRTASDAIEFIIAGATAVTIGTGGFINPDCAVKIIQGIKDYLRRQNITAVAELIGSLK